MTIGVGTLIVVCVSMLRLIFRSDKRNKTGMWLVVVFMLLSAASGYSQNAKSVLGQPAQGLKIFPMGSGCGLITGTVQQQLLPQFGHPKDWYVILACDDRTWDEIKSRAGVKRTDYAFSDLTRHYSYFRGTALLDSQVMTGRTRPAFIMAHEAAHILGGFGEDDRGELAADQIAERLLRRQPIFITASK